MEITEVTGSKFRFCSKEVTEGFGRKQGRAAMPRTNPLCRSDAERGTFMVGGTRNQCTQSRRGNFESVLFYGQTFAAAQS